MPLFGQNVKRLKKKGNIIGLIKALENPDWNVRNDAALALDELSWEPSSNKERVYYGIAKKMWEEVKSLGEIAIEPLIEALALNIIHNDAAFTLGKIGDPRAIPALIQMLGKEMERSSGLLAVPGFQASVMIYAATALNMIGKPAIGPLVQALGSEHKPTQAGAALTLSGMGEQAVAPLSQALDDENQIIRESAAKLIEKIKTDGDS